MTYIGFKEETPQYVRDFTNTVYPEMTELAVSFGSEEQCLKDATELLNSQRNKIRRLFEMLREVYSWLPNIEAGRLPMSKLIGLQWAQSRIDSLVIELDLTWKDLVK